jgi:hypothetical protein
MPYEQSTLEAMSHIRDGARVDRPTQLASAHIRVAGDTALFNILVGRVHLLGIYGEVTVQLAADASLIKLVANPTVGTSVDLCAASGSIASATVGQRFVITGTFATALVIAEAGASLWMAATHILGVGTIDLNSTILQSGLGQVKWSAWYMPLDDGAYVTSTL